MARHTARWLVIVVVAAPMLGCSPAIDVSPASQGAQTATRPTPPELNPGG